MLNELRQLHSEVLNCLDLSEKFTTEATPPTERLLAVRRSLIRASRNRTMLLERLFEKLSRQGDAGQPAAVERPNIKGKNNLVQSAEHTGYSPLRAVTGKWPDHRASFKSLRAQTRQRVAHENRILHPLFATGTPRSDKAAARTVVYRQNSGSIAR